MGVNSGSVKWVSRNGVLIDRKKVLKTAYEVFKHQEEITELAT